MTQLEDEDLSGHTMAGVRAALAHDAGTCGAWRAVDDMARVVTRLLALPARLDALEKCVGEVAKDRAREYVRDREMARIEKEWQRIEKPQVDVHKCARAIRHVAEARYGTGQGCDDLLRIADELEGITAEPPSKPPRFVIEPSRFNPINCVLVFDRETGHASMFDSVDKANAWVKENSR